MVPCSLVRGHVGLWALVFDDDPFFPAGHNNGTTVVKALANVRLKES